jgi:hypothetical protein
MEPVMTPSEQKIYDAIVEIKIQQGVFIEKHHTLKTLVDSHGNHIETMKADRNKIIGISWLGGGLLALAGLIFEFFKH